VRFVVVEVSVACILNLIIHKFHASCAERIHLSYAQGRLEEASALAHARIGKAVTRVTKSQLNDLGNNTSSMELWSCVRHLTGKERNTECVEGITADSLNKIITMPAHQRTQHIALRASSILHLTLQVTA